MQKTAKTKTKCDCKDVMDIKDDYQKCKLKKENDDSISIEPLTEEKRQQLVNMEKMWSDNKKYYLYREIAFVMSNYGKEIFKWLKDNETKSVLPSDFLEKHQLKSKYREKMVDWMIQVFSRYESSQGTFELAVQIMDHYIAKEDETDLSKNTIHLIGLTCIYMASKLEDNIPLRLKHVVKNIGHESFSKHKIICKERHIAKLLDFDFYKVGAYDYLLTYFLDLRLNNYERIKELDGKKIIRKYLNFCVFVSKLLLYDEYFSTNRPSLNFLAILTFGYDCVHLNSPYVSKDLRHLLRDWIYCITAEFGYTIEAVNKVYTKIYELYDKKIIKMEQALNTGFYLKCDSDDEDYVKRTNLATYYEEYFL